MKLLKNIISGFLAIAITVSLSAPAFALDPGVVVGAMEVAPDFGSWLWSGIKGGASIIGSFITDDICPGGVENPGLNARHDFIPQHTQVNGKTGMFYVCRNCQKAAGEVLEPAYDDYVSELPADNIDSQGMSSFYITGWFYSYGSAVRIISSESDYLCFEGYNSNDSSRFSVDATSGYFTVPVSGTYEVVFPSPSFSKIHDPGFDSFRCLFSGGAYNYEELGRLDTGFRKKLALVAGQSYCFRCNYIYVENEDSLPHGVAYYRCYRPYISGIFVSGLDSDTYNINTRPTSITGGNYGIVGDNGQIIKVEDNSTIINETNNTYYNPATGQTVPIVNWSYDYSDRSYKVTLESGDTATITYGDENITIQEGDTVYNIYYLIDGSGSENPPCEHDWQEGETTAPTCTLPGKASYICSKCQQEKTESIPALGHDWQVKQTVTTQYDDTGQLIQEGYTIFECSRCKEQYKSEDGTGPPDTPPEDPGEEEEKKGFFSWLWSVLTDAFKKLIEGIIDAILKTLDFFFGGDSQSNYDFYNSPSTFSGVSVWGS